MRAAGHGAQCFASRGIHTQKSVKLTDRAIRWLTQGGASGASDRNGGHAWRVHPSAGGGGGRGGGKEKGEGIKGKGAGGDGEEATGRQVLERAVLKAADLFRLPKGRATSRVQVTHVEIVQQQIDIPSPMSPPAPSLSSPQLQQLHPLPRHGIDLADKGHGKSGGRDWGRKDEHELDEFTASRNPGSFASPGSLSTSAQEAARLRASQRSSAAAESSEQRSSAAAESSEQRRSAARHRAAVSSHSSSASGGARSGFPRCVAFCTAETYDWNMLLKALQKDMVPSIYFSEVIHVSIPNESFGEDRRGGGGGGGGAVGQEGDVFFFRDGAMVLWDVSAHNTRLLFDTIQPLQVGAYARSQVMQTYSEAIDFTYGKQAGPASL
jgi:hypothetical protein